MNYIGSKQKLLPFISQICQKVLDGTEKVACDLFAGTGIVGKLFKSFGLQVISNDLQYYAYVLNKAYIELNHPPVFKKIIGKTFIDKKDNDVFNFLNNLPGIPGFISQNYSTDAKRFYYTPENARKIDAARQMIEQLKQQGSLTRLEYYYLLSSLLEAADKVANTACIYESYLKQFKKSATKPLLLRPLELASPVKGCKAFNKDANKLIEEIECDILYLDPPYNRRQYATNYHLLETIAAYDSPAIRGVTGIRLDAQRSQYCYKKYAKEAFEHLVQQAKTKHILLSYNNEGVISSDEICRILKKRGKVKVFQVSYNRFKADGNRTYSRNNTIEYLYYVRIKSRYS